MSETPNTVHGRLLEAVHISGYTFERACSELDWLLEEDRWKSLGFDDGKSFAESIYDLFSGFSTTIEQRRPLAKKLTEIMSQRAAAKVLGVDETTVRRDLGNRDAAKAAPVPNEPAENLDPNGEDAAKAALPLSGADVAKLAQAQAKKDEKQRQREEQNRTLNANATPLPEGKYAVIYADCPWSFKVWSGEGKDRAAENHFPTMSQDEIEALPIGDLAADDCALFLWAVMPQLPEALRVIRAWGFEYKTCAFVWVKQTKDGSRFATGMGYWTRANAELCLLATRGAPHRLNADVYQVIAAPRQEHSRKPDEAIERIERLVGGPYLELFARRTRDGWDAWGNQA